MTKIRNILPEDFKEYIEMAKVFYSMSCCEHNVDKSHFINAFEYCLKDNPYSKLFIIEYCFLINVAEPTCKPSQVL